MSAGEETVQAIGNASHNARKALGRPSKAKACAAVDA
jgi:hypothetical protein